MINIAHKVSPNESQIFLDRLLISGEYLLSVIDQAKVVRDPLISDEYLLILIEHAKAIRDPLISDEYLLIAGDMKEIRDLLVTDN